MPGGRPTDCTPEITTRIGVALRTGMAIRGACAIVGIDEKTYRNWLDRGDAGEEPFASFSRHTREQRAEGERELVESLKTSTSAAGQIFLLKASHGYRDGDAAPVAPAPPPAPPTEAEREADLRAYAAARGLRLVPESEATNDYDPATATKART